MTEVRPVRILVLVVIFRVVPASSSTLVTLRTQLEQDALSDCHLLKVIYDNSPERQGSPFEGFEYIHDPRNRGLIGAYEWALSRSRKDGIDWLLLLDQDSFLPADFLQKLVNTIRTHGSESKVAAVVPTVRSGTAVISPHVVKLGRLAPLRDRSQIQRTEITAINSGMAIRTDFLNEIGGFNRSYWLDFLDYWIFRQIYKRGWAVVVSDSVLQHDLSVRDYRNKVSPERYRNIVKAESMFVATERPRLEVPIYLTRLFIRALKQVALYPRLSLFTAGRAVWIVRRMISPERIGADEGNRSNHSS